MEKKLHDSIAFIVRVKVVTELPWRSVLCVTNLGGPIWYGELACQPRVVTAEACIFRPRGVHHVSTLSTSWVKATR